jgi:hypothetical protein
MNVAVRAPAGRRDLGVGGPRTPQTKVGHVLPESILHRIHGAATWVPRTTYCREPLFLQPLVWARVPVYALIDLNISLNVHVRQFRYR